MSDPGAVLLEHKERLMSALGPQQHIYLQNLKLWFRQKWTKEEFDRESRKLLGPTKIALHNQFFVALLNKVDPNNNQQQYATAQQQQPAIATAVMVPSANTLQPTPSATGCPPAAAASSSSSFSSASKATAAKPANIATAAAKRRKRPALRHPDGVRPPSIRSHFDAADLFAYTSDSVAASSLAASSHSRHHPHNSSSSSSSVHSAGISHKSPAALHMASAASTPPRYAAQELFLPDASLIIGRLLVGAWETGLSSADDCVADIIVLAVQSLLKNIVQSVISRRKASRVTGSGRCKFAYDFGAALPDPSLRSSLVRRPAPVDDSPLDCAGQRWLQHPGKYAHQAHVCDDLMQWGSCDQLLERKPARRVNVLDLYLTLSSERQLVPVHSVLALNVERMARMLH